MQLSLKAELLTAISAEVESAVGTATKKVLRITVEKTLQDIFFVEFESAEKRVQDCFYKFIKQVPAHLVAAGTLVTILALKFGEWYRSNALIGAIAHRIASSPKFFEPILIKELNRTAHIAR